MNAKDVTDMDLMWAPWRMPFIQKLKKPKGCFICGAIQSADDKAHFVVCRTKKTLALLNIYPYNNGHLMIAPKAHTGNMDHMSSEQWMDMIEVLQVCKCALDAVLKPDGYNVGINVGKAAGAGVASHLHIHLVPRWKGDMNFMPVTAATKVLPQALDESCRQISAAVKKAMVASGRGRAGQRRKV